MAVVAYDVLVTTVAPGGGSGPVTHRLAVLVWRVGRRVAAGPRSPVLGLVGPVILVAIVGTWIVGLWASWTLVFTADPAAVVNTETGELAEDLASRIYFAGYATYTLGLGDLRPSGGVWQVLTAAATTTGFALITMSVSYLIPVITAVVDRRTQGSLVQALGEDAYDIITSAWDGESFRYLDQPLLDIAVEISRTAERHLAYPVLHFFAGRSRTSAFEPNIAALDEAVLVLGSAVPQEIRPHAIALQAVRRSVDHLLEVVSQKYIIPGEDPPPGMDLSRLAVAGIALQDEAAYLRTLDEHAENRRRMAAFVADVRWDWDAVSDACSTSSDGS
jgi:hypothetical protein